MTNQLSRKVLQQITAPKDISIPANSIFDLPEKALQFGAGVLLRGLPDYFIDKANKMGFFNGRIVIVKSTAAGDSETFAKQDNLYTHWSRGVSNGVNVEEFTINAAVSRALSAKNQWQEVLKCAENPDMQVIISNTTEVGICLTNDNIHLDPPESFPGKLLAFLYTRYKIFNGDKTRGMVIVPTELITDNGDKLFSIVKELASQNGLDDSFTEWLETANYFCNSLVDRIVPNSVPQVLRQEMENKSGYKDELMITSEVYKLWAIEVKDNRAKDILSFEKADEGVAISEDIEVFREMKLRLLNGSHTFICALAHFSGFETVREAMADADFAKYVEQLMIREICPAIINSNLSIEQAESFAYSVQDRFRNPYIDHKWLSITLNFSSKMRMRNVSLLVNYFTRFGNVPDHMALGFASYLLFMKGKPEDGKYYGESNGTKYLINDESAGYFAEAWAASKIDDMVNTVLGNIDLWGVDLNQFAGFAKAIVANLEQLIQGNVTKLIQQTPAIASADKP